MTAGTAFINGQGMVSRGFTWGQTLTVVRRDEQAYGVERYVVKDSTGRHGYAY